MLNSTATILLTFARKLCAVENLTVVSSRACAGPTFAWAIPSKVPLAALCVTISVILCRIPPSAARGSTEMESDGLV